MEPMGKSPALESQRMRSRFSHYISKGAAKLLLCFCGYTIWITPQQSLAHALPFIAAQLHVSENQPGELRLSLAVDFASNPLITDEAHAQEALKNALSVHHEGKTIAIHQLAPLTFGKMNSWKSILPESVIPSDDDQPHEWLTASWSWKTLSPTVSFSVEKGGFNDVLLWRKEQNGEVKSMLLLAGDISSSIHVPQRSFFSLTSGITLVLVVLILAVIGWSLLAGHPRDKLPNILLFPNLPLCLSVLFSCSSAA